MAMHKLLRAIGLLTLVGVAAYLHRRRSSNEARDEADRRLDEALEETFPSSDPISTHIE